MKLFWKIISLIFNKKTKNKNKIKIEREGILSLWAQKFTDWALHYIPDAFIFALLATILIFILSITWAQAPIKTTIDSWGKGFWELIPFTMQMSLIIITGYVLATSKPIYYLITKISSIPKSAQGAILTVGLFAMITSWFNWGFSLIFSAILAKEVAKRREHFGDTDYRALAASSFLGLGSVWAQGISGSANLQMCTKEALQPTIREIVSSGGLVVDGLIPLKSTVFLWQTLLTVIVEIVVVALIIWFYTPTKSKAKCAKDLGINLYNDGDSLSTRSIKKICKKLTPGEWFEHTPFLNIFVGLAGILYLVFKVIDSENVISVITLNNINFFFLIIGIILHWTPKQLMKSFAEATPAVWGVILQFPFYAGIAGIITLTGLNSHIAHLFVSVSNHVTFPPLISLYSTILGVFVPSGGSKWVIEAPYVMAASHQLKVHLGWMVSVYNLGEALANLIQPFWMLPTLAILGLKARDVMGYTFIIFLILTPIVLIMVTLLNLTLSYPL